MSDQTATYDAPGVPMVTVKKQVSEVTGAKLFTVTLDLLGVAPDRGTTAEERRAGITSLEPPTIKASSVNEAIRLTVTACGNSIEATPGEELTGFTSAVLSFVVSTTVLQCMRKLGEDV